MSTIPPVRVQFALDGIAQAEATLKSYAQTLKSVQTQSAQGAKATSSVLASEAKKVAKSQEDALRFVQRAEQSTSRFLFSEWKKRQREAEKSARDQARAFERAAKEQQRAMERSAQHKSQSRNALIQNMGLGGVQSYAAMGGTMALAMIGVDLLKGALSLASEALKQFAGFVMNDIVKPGLKLGTHSMQIGNVVGASRGSVRGTMLALAGQYGGFDADTVSETLGIAAGHTKDLGQARNVADVALKMGQSLHGVAPTELAEMLGRRRASMPGLSDKEFEGFATLQMRKFLSKDSALNPKTMLEMRGQLEGFAERFGGNDRARAHSLVGISGLLGYAAKHGIKSGEEAGSAMEQTFGDLEKKSKGFAMRPGTSEFVPLNQSLPTLMKQYKGDLSAMRQAEFSEGSLKLYRALNVDTVFRSAEAKKAGSGEAAVKSHLEKIMMPEGAEDFNKEYQESQKDAAIRLQEAITRIKSSLMDKLLPVVEEKLIPAFTSAEPQILKFIDAFVKAIESMKNVDLVGIFTTIAQGIGAAMYHILNIMKKTGMINIDDKSLESLRAQSGANRTGTALANAPSNVVEGIFNAIPFGQYLKWTPTSMTIRGAAAAAKWIAGGDDNEADANAENFKRLTGPQPTQGPLLPENPFANSPEIKQLTQSMDRTAAALENYWYNNTPDRNLPMANRPPTG